MQKQIPTEATTSKPSRKTRLLSILQGISLGFLGGMMSLQAYAGAAHLGHAFKSPAAATWLACISVMFVAALGGYLPARIGVWVWRAAGALGIYAGIRSLLIRHPEDSLTTTIALATVAAALFLLACSPAIRRALISVEERSLSRSTLRASSVAMPGWQWRATFLMAVGGTVWLGSMAISWTVGGSDPDLSIFAHIFSAATAALSAASAAIRRPQALRFARAATLFCGSSFILIALVYGSALLSDLTNRNQFSLLLTVLDWRNLVGLLGGMVWTIAGLWLSRSPKLDRVAVTLPGLKTWAS